MQPPSKSNIINIAVGAEASRKVAWAKYYAGQEEIERLLKINLGLQFRIAELAIAIADNETLKIIEPEGELVKMATTTIAGLRLRARGKAALHRALLKRKAA